jgi:tellurite resistance-related uncharacterized protein
VSKLPENVSPYRTLGPFTEGTVPKGLLSEHQTKKGVWGILTVMNGSLRYTVTQERNETSVLLTPQTCGVIEPTYNHYLEITGPVKFKLTLYRVVIT